MRDREPGRSTAAAFGAAFLSLLLCAGPSAAKCALNAVEIPVEMQGLRPIVQTKVNGEAVPFLIDSGSYATGIDARVAAAQKLHPATAPMTGSNVPNSGSTHLEGVAGVDTVSNVVRANTFTIAGATFKNVAFLTLNLDAGGLLGQNFLHHWDVEYDFGHRVMKLVQVSDCADQPLAYWSSGSVYSSLPLEPSAFGDEHTIAVIVINGAPMKAWFDTGSPRSFMTRYAAARAGVKPAEAAAKPSGVAHGVDETPFKTWTVRFKTIKIGDEEVRNGALEVGDTDATSYDVLLGADFFLSHHIYVANSQKKIYFTYNGGPVFSDPAQQGASP